MASSPAPSATQILDDAAASNAAPEDYSHDQLRSVRTLLDESLWHFLHVVCRYDKLYYPLHGPVCEIVQRWTAPGHRRFMLQMPRDSFKTSVATIGNALWRKMRTMPNGKPGADIPLVIFNETDRNPVKWMRKMKKMIEGNRLVHRLYEDVIPPRIKDGEAPPKGWKWSDTELQLQSNTFEAEATITGLGWTAASTGGHWEEMIVDDILGPKHRDSPVEMEAARTWLCEDAPHLEKPASHGSVFVNCTPWAYHDAYYALLVMNPYDPDGDEGFRLYRRSALESGLTIFPDRWTTEKLLDMYRKKPFNFMCQQMCLPRAAREVSFQMEWLRYGAIGDSGGSPAFVIDHEHYDPTLNEADDGDEPPRVVPLHHMAKGLFFDPAPTEGRERRQQIGSRNGLAMEGIDPWGRRFLLDTRAVTKDIIGTVHEAFAMLDEWGCDRMFVEDVSFTKVFKHVIRREAELAGRHVHVVPCPPGKTDKDTRIQARFPDHARGIYYLNRGRTNPFVQEAMQYSPGAVTVPNDILDGLGYDRMLGRPETPYEVDLYRYHEEMAATGADGRDTLFNY